MHGDVRHLGYLNKPGDLIPHDLSVTDRASDDSLIEYRDDLGRLASREDLLALHSL